MTPRSIFRYLIVLVVLASISSIVYGFTVVDSNQILGNKCIGFGTVGLFLVAMPLFLIRESRGKKVKDYMLTEDNLRKMQGKPPKSSENQ
jgi:hypothetical protein